jgi:hypothetical protein
MNNFENLFSPICGMSAKSVSEISHMAGFFSIREIALEKAM